MKANELVVEIESELSENFSVKMRSLLEFLFAVNMGKKEVKGNLFRPHALDRLVESKFNDDLINENQLRVREYNYSVEDFAMAGELLERAGYLVSKWAYMDDDEDNNDGMYVYNQNDEEEAEWIKECIVEKEKSEKAFEKYGSEYSEDYQKERGRIVHPWNGRENYDPLYSFFKIIEWTDKLSLSNDYVKVMDSHMLKAFKEIVPENFLEKVNERAKEIAIEEMRS